MSKVIFINRFFYPDHSATSQMLSDLAFGLASQNLAVEVITSRLLYDGKGPLLPSRQLINAVTVHRVWTSQFGRVHLAGRAIDYLTFYLSVVWTLARRVRRGDTVVVKTDPPLLGLVVVPVVMLFGARWVNWLQDVYPDVAAVLDIRFLKGWLFRFLKAARNATLRGAFANVVVGQRMAQRIRQEIAEDSNARITLIHNWADGSAIRPVAHEINDLRKSWGVGDKFVIGYSGNMGRAHELAAVLDAAEILQDLSAVIFLFIGGGSQRPALELEARRRGLRNVLFKPYQDRGQLSFSLGAADVHLISLNPAMEGLIVPSKFYGIAAAGRAIVFMGDANGEIASMLREFCCGLTVESGDGQQLAGAIRKLFSDHRRCIEFGTNARRLLEEKFEKRIAIAAWKDLLTNR